MLPMKRNIKICELLVCKHKVFKYEEKVKNNTFESLIWQFLCFIVLLSFKLRYMHSMFKYTSTQYSYQWMDSRVTGMYSVFLKIWSLK